MIYSLYSDNVAPNAAWSVDTGTEDATYPAANIADRIVAKPAQLSTTTGSWTGDFSAAQRADWFALLIDNLTPGLTVRYQMHTAASWGTPDLTTTITIPSRLGDGFPPGAWKDLTGVAGYTVGGKQFHRLLIEGVNAEAVKVGELAIISTKRTLNPNLNWPVRRSEQRPIIENVTDYGVSTIYDYGVTRRRIEGSLDVTDTVRDQMLEWWRDARGRARPFVLVPDEDVNEAVMVRFARDMVDVDQQLNDRNVISLAFEEVSRGLVLQNV